MTVNFSSGSYTIIQSSLESLPSRIDPDTFLFTDETVAATYPELVGASLNRCVLPPGEQTKSLEYFGKCLNWLASSGATRSSKLVALGGGVIGDLIGFVASAYMRGVKYVQIPTTLLAQVDSSVGGKVAIDLAEGKNLAGAFYPPYQVIICPEFLSSLPRRQIRNGLAEVLKYGFISQPNLLTASESEVKSEESSIVRDCIEIKAAIVEADEFETTGLRATLNFGHTIGHAIEKLLEYRDLLHGEAIAIGMVIEARLGESLGITPPGTAEKVQRVLNGVGLPTTHAVLHHADGLIASMYKDKKAIDRTLTFSLLTAVGDCKLVSNVSEASVRKELLNG